MTINQHGAKVGDLISYSWGYDQTNIDLFKVTKVTAKTVTIEAINPDGTTSTWRKSDNGRKTTRPYTSRVNGQNTQSYCVYFDHGIGRCDPDAVARHYQEDSIYTGCGH